MSESRLNVEHNETFDRPIMASRVVSVKVQEGSIVTILGSN